MKMKSVGFIVTFIILISTSFFLVFVGKNRDTSTSVFLSGYKGPTVTVSGNITFKDYKEGNIFILAHSRDPHITNAPADIAMIKIPKPGSYKVKVPRNMGKLYLGAVCISSDNVMVAQPPGSPLGWYAKNPLKIGPRNIRGINITMTTGGSISTQLSTKMDTYKGPTVTVSGNITYKDYKEGFIFIEAHSRDPHITNAPPDIAMIKIPKPGHYEVKVPRNMGKLYLAAMCLPAADILEEPGPDAPMSLYAKNPIKVGSDNIEGVDMYIITLRGLSTKMDTYKGPTVTVSGNITFKDYKEGNIFILAHSKDPLETNAPPDIAMIKIPKPGHYEVKVPRNMGKLYLAAMCLPAADILEEPGPDAPVGWYAKNPITVEYVDIKEIDINVGFDSNFPISGVPVKMDTYKGPTVTVSGNITYKDYKEGFIFIEAHSKDPLETNAPPDIAMIKIPKPGHYEVKVPRNMGKLYLAAMCLPAADILEEPGPDAPVGWYAKNPITVGYVDIKEIDINVGFDSNFPISGVPVKMDTYKGPTVTVSGNITFKDYKEGSIFILAHSKNPYMSKEPPDINVVKIPKPGPYEVKVPRNMGELYLAAMCLSADGILAKFPADTPTAWYSKNPIKVGSKDIKRIDMEIVFSQQEFVVKMDTYKGPTVTVSGNITFKDYKEGSIFILAHSKNPYMSKEPPDINVVKIPKPGPYEVKVPRNMGELYLAAMYLPTTDILEEPGPDAPVGWYSKNPISIKLENIKGIDIEIAASGQP